MDKTIVVRSLCYRLIYCCSRVPVSCVVPVLFIVLRLLMRHHYFQILNNVFQFLNNVFQFLNNGAHPFTQKSIIR